MNRTVKRAFLLGLLLLFGIAGFFLTSEKARKSVQLRALDKIGDVAVDRMASNPDAAGSVAADFINIPIETRKIADGVYQATGVGNAHLITTSDGHVVFDTGLPTQVTKQIKVLEPHMNGIDVSHIIVSHSHADHAGGVKAWFSKGMDIIAHEEFEEEQRYLSELQDYQWGRNRTLFPFMPEEPPKMGLLAYGGIEPTIKVRNGAPYKFSQGGVDFEVLALPGAEGADNVVLWLPQKRILFAGDFFGPLFPQFPNIFTMRGEKIRKPVEYANSLDVIINLDPDVIVPSHKNPITDKGVIREGLIKMRDATRFVHDATVKGMNEGKSLEQLMTEIALPPELALSQEHGRVSWAVKSIWEYYMTWFHFDKTTELYPVPQSAIYTDLINITGEEKMLETARGYLDSGEPLKALHMLEILEKSQNQEAWILREAALEELLNSARETYNNSYEIYWLNYKIREARDKLAGTAD